MMNPKILFLSMSDGFGGLELQMALRTKEANNRFGFGLFITKINSKISKYCKENSIPNIDLNQTIPYVPLILAYKISRIITKYQINKIVCSKSNELSIAILARKFAKIKPQIYFYQQMQNGIIKKDIFHNWVYKNTDGAIVIAEFMKKQLAETTIIPENKIEFVYIGIELDKYNPLNFNKVELRKKLNIPPDSFVIINIARMDSLKDQGTLIKAFADANIPDSLLLLVGEGEHKNIYQELVTKLGLSDKVRFLGFRKDLPELLNASDLFVLPTLSETLGIVLLEAMASRLPVIGTNSGGVPELIQNGHNGFLFEPKDNETLKELIIKIYKDKYTTQQMAENAFKFVQKEFDYKTQTDKFFDFLLRN
ncbi:MAG: glycosyltransferase family 4 protein [Candidatus Kapaibacteriota bacterium]